MEYAADMLLVCFFFLRGCKVGGFERGFGMYAVQQKYSLQGIRLVIIQAST